MFTVTVAQEIAAIFNSLEYCKRSGGQGIEQHERRLELLLRTAIPNKYKLVRERTDSEHIVFTFKGRVFVVYPTFGGFRIDGGNYPSELEEALYQEYETEWPSDV